MKRTALALTFIVALLVSMIGVATTVHFGTAQSGTNVTGIITSDTTWTQANSPYTLTGNVLVNNGVTLTIDAGTTVNLASYYIMVNGTLEAIGNSANPITLNSGEINFTQYSTGWNDLSLTGCIIQNANINSTSILSDVSLKIDSVQGNNIGISTSTFTVISNSSISGQIFMGANSIIEDSSLTCTAAALSTGNSSVIANNKLIGGVLASNFTSLTNNYINGSITSGSISIINNTVIGTITINEPVSTNSTISNNTIRGGGAVWYYGLAPFPRYPIYAISVIDVGGGSVEIANNAIISQDLNTLPASDFDGGYGITVQVDSNAYIHNNTISEGFTAGIDAVGPSIIEDNSIINNTGGIAIGKTVYDYGFLVAKGETIIENNILSNTAYGIGGPVVNPITITDDNFVLMPYNITVENNLIVSSSQGIEVDSEGTIENNTISNDSNAILNDGIATIRYNNIESFTQHSIVQGTSNDTDATYNWWGTTNTTAISQSIYDYYDDFNLGKVNYTPILTGSNLEAPVIPYFAFSALAGTGGSISPSGSFYVLLGENESFLITPDNGYHIAGVLVNGISVGPVASYSVQNVYGATTISATFAPNTYTITVTQTANGNINPGTFTINYGDSPTFTVTPNSGYYIASITTDAGAVTVTSSSGQTFTFSNVKTAHTLTATYALTPTVTPTPTPTPTAAPTTASNPTSTPVSTPTSTASSSNTTPSPTPSVSEFPTWIILPLFALIILLSTVFIRKRASKK